MSSTQEIKNSNKRRWLNIGPGLAIALAVSAFVGSQWVKAEIETRQQYANAPIVERQVVSSSAEKSGPTPEVQFIIDHAKKLNVSKSQAARLEKLQAKWIGFYGPRMASANKAVEKTNSYLSDAKGRSRTPVAQIQESAAPVIALSGEISSAKQSYWNQASSILTATQRRALEAERRADWAAKAKLFNTKTASRS